MRLPCNRIVISANRISSAILSSALFAFVAALSAPAEAQSVQKPVLEIQGHRGCRGLMPENTLVGFVHAVDLGVRVLELDVCISADSQVVVSHEPWLSREICLPHEMMNQNEEREPLELKFFSRITYGHIASYDCGSKGHPNFPQQQKQFAQKPLLRDVFLVMEEKAGELGYPIRYNIELKSRPEWDGVKQPGPEQSLPLLLAEIERAELSDVVSIQSFDYRALRLLHELRPDLPVVQLVEENPLLAVELKRLGFKPDVYSPWHKLVTRAMVRSAHRKGIRVIPWTVNEAADMQRLAAMGVDGLITDYPNIALEYFSPE